MAQMIQLMTPDGMKTYPVYNECLEMLAAYDAGGLCDGSDVLYRGCVWSIVGRFADEDGEHYLEMLEVMRIGPEFTFSVCG